MIQLFFADLILPKNRFSCELMLRSVHILGIASYNSALNPTKNVSSSCSVGARRLPLRPITALRMASCESTFGAKTSTFLPLATRTD